MQTVNSVAVLAEISLRSPRKLFVSINKKIHLQDQSIPKIKKEKKEKNFTGSDMTHDGAHRSTRKECSNKRCGKATTLTGSV